MKKTVKKKALPPGRKRASAVRKKTVITKRPTAPPIELKAVPDPKPDKVNKKPGLVYYTLEQIKKFERMHPNHNAAVEALTQAFKDNNRIAIRDRGVTINQIPAVWVAMSDYVELDGVVIKARA